MGAFGSPGSALSAAAAVRQPSASDSASFSPALCVL